MYPNKLKEHKKQTEEKGKYEHPLLYYICQQGEIRLYDLELFWREKGFDKLESMYLNLRNLSAKGCIDIRLSEKLSISPTLRGAAELASQD